MGKALFWLLIMKDFKIEPVVEFYSFECALLQVDLCKKVINIYRYLVMNISMEQKTWYVI